VGCDAGVEPWNCPLRHLAHAVGGQLFGSETLGKADVGKKRPNCVGATLDHLGPSKPFRVDFQRFGEWLHLVRKHGEVEVTT